MPHCATVVKRQKKDSRPPASSAEPPRPLRDVMFSDMRYRAAGGARGLWQRRQRPPSRPCSDPRWPPRLESSPRVSAGLSSVSIRFFIARCCARTGRAISPAARLVGIGEAGGGCSQSSPLLPARQLTAATLPSARKLRGVNGVPGVRVNIHDADSTGRGRKWPLSRPPGPLKGKPRRR